MAIDQEQRAAMLWDYLIELASQRKTANYKAGADAIGIHHRPIMYALAPIQTYCLNEGLPRLTALLVSKSSGLQGHGYAGVAGDRQTLENVWNWDWSKEPNPFKGVDNELVDEAVEAILNDPNSTEEYSKRLGRGNEQRVFRRAALAAYQYKCCVCELSFEPALEAAHILPWAVCDAAAKIDPRNSLVLCATHHRLYDADYFTVDAGLAIAYCDPGLDEGPYTDADKDIIASRDGQKIHLPKQQNLRPNPDFIRMRNELHGWGT